MNWKKCLNTTEANKIEEIEKHYPSFFIKCDNDELGDEDLILFYVLLVNSGLVWKIQGGYGRTAMSLVGQNYLSLSFDTQNFKEAISRLTIFQKLLIRLDLNRGVQLWKADKLSDDEIIFLIECLDKSKKRIWLTDKNAERVIARGLKHQYFFVVPNFEKVNDGGGL